MAPTTPISVTDNTVSTMMPLEKTSRWPRFINHRGRKESSATKLVRNGKPLKLVLPPVYRISAVAACTTQNMKCPADPNTMSASCEITVG